MSQFSLKCFKSVYRSLSISTTLLLIIGSVAVSQAQNTTIFNSIPNPIPPNVASEGPEAYAFSEIGDGLNLAGPTGRTLSEISVVLSSWGCKSGNWYTAGTCVTPKNATFTQPITINVYSVLPGPVVGPLLATTTQTFILPYRPSSDSVHCDGTAWYNSKDQKCYHGLAAPITVNLSSSHVTLPSQVVVGVSFNSTHYGPSPIGQAAACYSTSAGCPYDSLNVSTDSNGGVYTAIGSTLDPNGIFVNYTLPNNSCTGAAAPGLALDVTAGCWAGYHPMIQVTAKKNENEKDNHHGNKHNGHDGNDC